MNEHVARIPHRQHRLIRVGHHYLYILGPRGEDGAGEGVVERDGLGDSEGGHEQENDGDAGGVGTTAINVLQGIHAKSDIGVRAWSLTCFCCWPGEERGQ